MGTVEAGLPLADPAADADRARLQQLGYKQELKRGLSYALRFLPCNFRFLHSLSLASEVLIPFGFNIDLCMYGFSSVVSNFAFSFAIISVLTGVTTTYNTGLRYGGLASMTLGWLVVAAFNGCVALSMAEICSAYPTSGGLYYWSAKLAGKDWAPLASWVTGW